MKFFTILGIALFALLDIIFGGFVLTKLWAWFIIPLFDLPSLTIPNAIGINFVINYFTPYKKNKEEKINYTELISVAIAKPLVYLTFGYIIKSFI